MYYQCRHNCHIKLIYWLVMIITIECDKMNVNTMYSSIERSIKDEVHVVAKKEKKKEMELKMDLLL